MYVLLVLCPCRFFLRSYAFISALEEPRIPAFYPQKDASKQSVKMCINKRIVDYYPEKNDSDIPERRLADLARIYALVPEENSLSDKIKHIENYYRSKTEKPARV